MHTLLIFLRFKHAQTTFWTDLILPFFHSLHGISHGIDPGDWDMATKAFARLRAKLAKEKASWEKAQADA
jgi:hypothetical protein